MTRIILDIDNIWRTLYQGSMPPRGSLLKEKGFDVLVLCASEHQDASVYEGIEVLCAPGDDDHDDLALADGLRTWEPVARQVAAMVLEGKKVLVTCMAGHNRSGVVSAIALHHITGWSGLVCRKHVQNRRQYALTNRLFEAHVDRSYTGEEPVKGYDD